jgi:aminocarboxymuconate-semialdehyde decarboxylase
VTGVIDTHAHIIVPEIIRAEGTADAWRPLVEWRKGRQVVEIGGTSITSAVREFVRIERILEEQEAAGVGHVVLSPWVQLLPYDLPMPEATRVCRIQNEALAEITEANPDRVSALGTIPMQEPEFASRELERLMALPGLRGVEVAASVQGVYLGDDRFSPLWEIAEATGAAVLVHPTTRGFDLPVFRDFYLWNTVGNPMETATTAAHMVMAGVLERHPSLRVILAHGGGALMSARGRLQHAFGFQPQAQARLEEPPAASLRRLFYDTLTHDVALLRDLVEWVGAEHVVLGSDYPFDMGADQPVEDVRALALSTDEEDLILRGNAARLFGIQGVASSD